VTFATATNVVCNERDRVDTRAFSLIVPALLLLGSVPRPSTAEMIQPRKLVDAHTAGILRKGQYDIECRFYQAGDTTLGTGITFGFDIGVTNRLTLGLSYGGEGIVGRGRNIRPHHLPGWLVKYRLIEEHVHFPAIALGYDHQGRGGLTDTIRFSYEGYIFKSPGFFLAASKNYLLFNTVQLGLHAMCNYSMEDCASVTWPNLITGIDLGINEELSLVFEYDFAFTYLDVHPGKPSRYARPSDAYLNAGVRWAFSSNFYIELDFRDILERRTTDAGDIIGWNREIKLAYFAEF
jgi:hypothetical protein